MGYLLSVVGTLLLIHAAYSCLHYRSLLQELEDSLVEDATATAHQIPPVDVYIEVAVGFVVLLTAELIRSGSSLQPVQSGTAAAAKKRPLMAPGFRSRDFDIYSHRCKGL